MMLLCSLGAQAQLAKSTVLEDNVAYLRVAQTDTNLPDEIQSALSDMQSTNPIAGIVLDLRSATGDDTDVVKPTAAGLEGKKLPLAILVNAQTHGAAARLAHDLREANAGLVFGESTTPLRPDISVPVAASDEKDYLKNPYGVMPLTDTNIDSTTNFLPVEEIDHTSEAELVRDKVRDADGDDSTPTNVPAAPLRPYIRDPVLAHGVDFIKGIAALHLGKG